MLDCKKHLILEPPKDCVWASKMVLNPAMIQDPEQENIIHMLFRATGPCENKRLKNKPLPYPISLGYAVSHDYGESWEFDFNRPALAPALKYRREDVIKPDETINYTNGCIEDPRLFYFENRLYLSAACRVFPPGPYWEKDDPRQCMPEWAKDDVNIKRAVRENYTVSVLFKVNLSALAAHDYDSAFEYAGPLHDPEAGDNRDVFLFPERIGISGKKKVVCLHRPMKPAEYLSGTSLSKPSIFIATADSIEQLATDKAEHSVLASPVFEWENNRTGASWPPIKISSGRWLLAYHGKQDSTVGYTQSFMILKEQKDAPPTIEKRCSERLMYASEPWELGTDFPTPCLFTCSGIVIGENKLLMGYGAADQKIGIAETDFTALIDKMSK